MSSNRPSASACSRRLRTGTPPCSHRSSDTRPLPTHAAPGGRRSGRPAPPLLHMFRSLVGARLLFGPHGRPTSRRYNPRRRHGAAGIFRRKGSLEQSLYRPFRRPLHSVPPSSSCAHCLRSAQGPKKSISTFMAAAPVPHRSLLPGNTIASLECSPSPAA